MIREVFGSGAKKLLGLTRKIPGRYPAKYNVVIERRRNGELLETRELRNLVVDVGKEAMAKRFCGVSENPFQYIAVGTGTTAPAASDTALESEITDGGLARAQDSDPVVNSNVAELEVVYNVTASYAVTESGVFNAGSGGVMAARVTFDPLNVQDGDTLTIKWQFTFG